MASHQFLGAALVQVLQFEEHLFLKLLLIVLKLGAFLDDFLEEDIVLILAEYPLRELFVFSWNGQTFLVMFLFEIFLDDLPVLPP